MKNEKKCFGICSVSCPQCSFVQQSQSITALLAADVKGVRENICAAMKECSVDSKAFSDLTIALAFLNRFELNALYETLKTE